MVTAPHKIKLPQVFDAIAQALEFIIGKSNNESVDFATKSLKISIENYFIKKPNLENAAKMSTTPKFNIRQLIYQKLQHLTLFHILLPSLFNISHGHSVGLFEKF